MDSQLGKVLVNKAFFRGELEVVSHHAGDGSPMLRFPIRKLLENGEHRVFMR